MLKYMNNLQKVVAVQDDSFHWYIIPFESKDKFYQMLEDIENQDENDDIDRCTEFDVAFGHYRTGGDLNNKQLYAEL